MAQGCPHFQGIRQHKVLDFVKERMPKLSQKKKKQLAAQWCVHYRASNHYIKNTCCGTGLSTVPYKAPQVSPHGKAFGRNRTPTPVTKYAPTGRTGVPRTVQGRTDRQTCANNVIFLYV